MKTVYSKDELQQALNNRESIIEVRGELAKEMYHKVRRKKRARWLGGIIILGSIAAIPFSGGASIMGLTAGATSGLICGTLTLTTTEVIILCGTIIALAGILKGAKVKIRFEESGMPIIIIEPQYKDIQKEVNCGAN